MKKLLFGLVLALCTISLSGCIIETYSPPPRYYHYHYMYRYDGCGNRILVRVWHYDCH